ncbi:hypothetical protein [Marinicrinis sediminis]|uniref:Phage tail protein n=1 Tax=Marinicrinis sediminis TaxID=1652465 RepID=A0ABW5RAP8_9BACL
MNIIFAANNFEETITLPIIPAEFAGVNEPWKNQEFETMKHGTIKLIGTKGLRNLSISSFFPRKEYDFAKDKRNGMEYVQFFKRWRAKRVPIRIIITLNDGSEFINMAVTVDEFTYSLDRAEDIPYALTLSEFVFIKV